MRSILLVLVIALAAVAGCVAKPNASPSNNSTDSTSGMNMTSAMPLVVTVGGGVCPPNPPAASPDQYTLSPKKLDMKVGMKYNVTLKNTGCAAHDLVIDGIDGAKIANVAPGKDGSVEFTATKAGTFPMYCTLGGGPTAPATSHKDHGMSGQAVVA